MCKYVFVSVYVHVQEFLAYMRVFVSLNTSLFKVDEHALAESTSLFAYEFFLTKFLDS